MMRFDVSQNIDNNAMLSSGYGFISNHQTARGKSGVNFIEHRIWEQFYIRHELRNIRMEHRYRLEQRWLKRKPTLYLDRIRYFYRVTIPISNKQLLPNTLFLSFYNEVFLNITDNPFDRNRLYGATGYQFTKDIAGHAGYLLQTTSTGTKPYLQLAIFWNVDLRPEN
ncbi:MAG: DUF2490 domain-containing protein [Bacteroidia bacterium]